MANPLARVAMNNIANKTRKNNLVKTEGNITTNEESLIRNIISGETEIIEENNKPKLVTLEEVAEKIKGNR
ncbi:MAG TPA: hypothetical protein VK071_13580 [Tissierellales bacterium]|nr:hypothetical protein [Tissierellales bacterium]